MKPLINTWIALAILLLTACSPQAAQTPVFEGNNSYAPQPGDSDLVAEDIRIESSSVFMAKSQPPQLLVNFDYFPPTTCHELRVEVSGPDDQNEVQLKAYGVIGKDQVCTLMALEEPLQASLNLGSFPSGHYTVVLNGNQIGAFDS